MSLGNVEFLDPKSISVSIDDEGIEINIDDEIFDVHRIALAFPSTNPNRYIGFINDFGREIGMLADMDDLDQDSRVLLEQELKRIYFIPTILEILAVERKGTGSEWTVVTDDGEKTFRIHDRSALDDSNSPEIIIRDNDQQRYKIDNFWNLDPDSIDLGKDLMPDRVIRAKYGSGKNYLSRGSSGRGGGRGSFGRM